MSDEPVKPPLFLTCVHGRGRGQAVWRAHDSVRGLRVAVSANSGYTWKRVRAVLRLHTDGTWERVPVDDVLREEFA